MPPGAPLWIAEADVVSVMDMDSAIRTLEQGLLAEARGDAHNMPKTHVAWGDGTLHAIGAAFPKAGFVGTKTWAHTQGGATPLLILYESQTGALLAIVEAFALGQMRTGGASGVATRWLAAEGADELAIVGTGKQALAQVAAVAVVRPLKRVRVFGRNEERRAQFVTRVERELGLAVAACTTVAEAVKDAPIITVVTRATEPFLHAAMVTRGAHVNAVGAIVPSGAEVAGDVLARCSQIVVDNIKQAQRLSRELIEFLGAAGGVSWGRVASLASLVAAGRPLRPPQASSGDATGGPQGDLTLFKSLGMGISDLSLGIEVYQTAVRLGLGRSFAPPQWVAPRLRHSGQTGNRQGAQIGTAGV